MSASKIEIEYWDRWTSDLMAGSLGGDPSLFDLGLICDAIAAHPYRTITDGVLRINGGMLPKPLYDSVMSALVQDGVLRPIAFNTFEINRSKVPCE